MQRRPFLFLYASQVEPGTLLHNRYRIHKILTRNNLGNTYQAADQFCHGELRVLEGIVADPVRQVSVQDALAVLQQLEAALYQAAHPCIPHLTELFSEGNRAFSVRHYIQGKTLDKFAEPVPEAIIIDWIRDLLGALAQIHQQGIYHDNIAPENIVIHHQTKRPVMINFNCAEALITASKAARKGSAMLQSAFISDVYTLAVLAISLLIRVDFHALMTTRNWIPHWQQDNQVNPVFAQVLNQMLSLYSHCEYQNANAFLAVLSDF